MPLSFVTFPERDFSGGIDARSSEIQIDPGYARDILNADIIEKRVKKRKGYQGYAGNLPVRVTSVEYKNTDNQICFTLDGSLDLSANQSTPIIVYGRTSSSITSGGPFTNAGDVAKYYDSFEVQAKKVLATGTNTLEVDNTEHDIDSASQFVEIVESTSSNNRSHSLIYADAIQIDESTYDIDIDYTNGTGAAKNAYVYYKDKTPSGGSIYVGTISHTGSGSETFNITAATHALSSYNLLIRVQEDLGLEREFIIPDSVEIQTDGQVNITIDSSSAKTFYAILSPAPSGNLVSGTVAAGATSSLTIEDIESPWIFVSIYVEQSPGGTKEQVIPNTVTYNDATGDVDIEFVNSTASDTNFFVYYEFGSIRASQICVADATISADVTDTRPQLSIWGLDHSEIYGTTATTSREGWVNHIDAYKRSGESRLIAGLGGNIFSARTYSEESSTYLYPQLYPYLQGRLASEHVVGPCFWVNGSTPARTRGYVTGSNVSSSNEATISAVEYDSGNGWTKYTLSLTSMSILDSTGASTTIGNVISTTTDLEDYLTVTQMSNSRHEGTFKIKQVTSGTDEVYIWADNSSITGTNLDDTGCAGKATLNSDRLTLLANAPFISGDILTNPNISGASLTITVKSSSTTSVTTTGWSSLVTVPSGVVTTGTRTSAVIPMRSSLLALGSSVTNLLRGDMISYTGINRLLRVKSINPDSDKTVNITADGTTATATLTSGDTSALRTGAKISLLYAGVYTGVQTIASIPTTTTFTFSTSSSDSASSATLVGATAEVDENLTWSDTESDTNCFRVEKRWIPIEAPDDSYGLTPNTYIRHFDNKTYALQDFLRSNTVVDNMYITNGSDEVQKFDGTNTYRAGLIPWQPGLFTTVDENAAAKIPADNPTATPSAISVNIFTVPAGDEKKFPIGSRVRHRFTGGYNDYNVLDSYYPGTGSDGFVKVQKTTTGSISLGSSPTLTRLSSIRYYFRLNAIDANNNIIASAVTGSQDFVVELAGDAAVNIKMVGMPVWDVYDYDRLEVEIYRTLINEVAPFYKIDTIQMDFDNTQGYINYTDVYSDDNLIDLDETSVLKGAELGIAWSDPLRAKYVTALGNRLVLGNIKDYPELDIQLVAQGSVTNSTYAGKKFTFRRDDTASGTTTDMVNTCVYEFINGTTGDVSSVSIGTDDFTVNVSGSTASISVGDWIYLTYENPFPQTGVTSTTFVDVDVNTGLDTITITSHGLVDNQEVKLENSGGALPTGLDSSTTYYIINATTNDFQLSTSLGGSAVDITAASGGGTHSIFLQGNNLTYSGWWQIASKTSSSVTINLTGAAAVNSYPDKYVLATDPTDIPVLLGADGNLGMFNGDSLDLFDTMRRMSLAINTTMRMVDTGISGMATFTPWMISRAGNDVAQAGRLIIRQPRADSTTMEVLLPSSFSGSGVSFSVFVNGVRQSTSAQISASTKLFPSRILVSYENYPEIMDNPTAIVESESDSVIDVNSADGQQITGIIPFFGESAFGAAQQSGVLVVFKESSIYLVDINEKIAGRNPVQRIESEGLGCTAPYSIAPTKNGIMFGNESGLYCLRRNQTIEYLGKFMERKWKDSVNLSSLDVVQGHSYGLGRQYKVSVPLNSDTSNSEVYVYDHTLESSAKYGAWTRYDNHPATGWANLAPEAYFGTTSGRIMSIRRAGESSDYRDDSSAISFRLDTRANDFGNGGVRKVFGNIITHYRVSYRNTGTTFKTALDTERTYYTSTTPIIPVSDIGTYTAQDVVSVSHSINRRRGMFLQVRIENSTIDEDLEISGIDFRVAGLSDSGILEARNTQDK